MSEEVPAGGGISLGLRLVQGLAGQNGGSFTLETSEGTGCVVEFPLQPPR
jgi:two-component sensor histidine kinase